MSAFIVSNKHIAYIVAAAMKYQTTWIVPGEVSVTTLGDSTYESLKWALAGQDRTPGQIGAILHAENVRSVDERYDEENDEEPYVHPRRSIIVDPVQVIKACHCYTYQSCEHDGWEQSEAKNIVDSVIKAACGRLPGYEEADWEIV